MQKPLVQDHTSLLIRKLTQERSPLNVMNVENLLAGSHNSFYIREHTQERDPMNVVSVREPLWEVTANYTSKNSLNREAL